MKAWPPNKTIDVQSFHQLVSTNTKSLVCVITGSPQTFRLWRWGSPTLSTSLFSFASIKKQKARQLWKQVSKIMFWGTYFSRNVLRFQTVESDRGLRGPPVQQMLSHTHTQAGSVKGACCCRVCVSWNFAFTFTNKPLNTPKQLVLACTAVCGFLTLRVSD